MELDGGALAGRELAGGLELGDVTVGCDDSGSSTGEADCGMAGTTTKIQDPPVGWVADEALIKVSSKSGPELDMADRPGEGAADVVIGHRFQ